jgi:hypothetical protein
VKDAGTAVSFDGVDDYVTGGDNYDFTGTAAFTAEAWVRPSVATSTAYRCVVTKFHAPAWANQGGWAVCIYPSSDPTNPNKLYFARLINSNASFANGVTLAANSWSHVVATYDGTNMRLYVNGTLVATTASALTLANTTDALLVNGLAANGTAGLMDEAAVYSSALSAQQVTEHYNAGRR